MSALEMLSAVLLAAGALFVLIGSLGLVRLPDFFSRTHAAGITDSAGSLLMLAGLLCLADTPGVAVRLLLIAVFLLFASPTASHALAQAAIQDGIKPLLGGGKRR